jgi:hypothetical protein
VLYQQQLLLRQMHDRSLPTIERLRPSAWRGDDPAGGSHRHPALVDVPLHQ